MAEWKEGRVARQRAWNATHYSLHIDCDLPPFTAGQFVRIGLDIEGERVARPYSCVNAPHQRGVEILFNVVPEGPLTQRLARLADDTVLFPGHDYGDRPRSTLGDSSGSPGVPCLGWPPPARPCRTEAATT